MQVPSAASAMPVLNDNSQRRSPPGLQYTRRMTRSKHVPRPSHAHKNKSLAGAIPSLNVTLDKELPFRSSLQISTSHNLEKEQLVGRGGGQGTTDRALFSRPEIFGRCCVSRKLQNYAEPELLLASIIRNESLKEIFVLT